MLCCFSGTTYDVITFLICIKQKSEYLQNEKRYAKKKNAIPLYSEMPSKQEAIIFYFIGTLREIREPVWSYIIDLCSSFAASVSQNINFTIKETNFLTYNTLLFHKKNHKTHT